jgi:hypothetical protein
MTLWKTGLQRVADVFPKYMRIGIYKFPYYGKGHTKDYFPKQSNEIGNSSHLTLQSIF